MVTLKSTIGYMSRSKPTLKLKPVLSPLFKHSPTPNIGRLLGSASFLLYSIRILG